MRGRPRKQETVFSWARDASVFWLQKKLKVSLCCYSEKVFSVHLMNFPVKDVGLRLKKMKVFLPRPMKFLLQKVLKKAALMQLFFRLNFPAQGVWSGLPHVLHAFFSYARLRVHAWRADDYFVCLYYFLPSRTSLVLGHYRKCCR